MIDFLLTDEPKTVSGTAIKDNKLLEYFEAVDKMEPSIKNGFDLIDLISLKLILNAWLVRKINAGYC